MSACQTAKVERRPVEIVLRDGRPAAVILDIDEYEEMLERLGAAEAVMGSVTQAERLSRRHWTLVYLCQDPEWSGQGVLVDVRDRTGTVLIPELAFETRIHLKENLELNSTLQLTCRGVNLPELEAYFQID